MRKSRADRIIKILSDIEMLVNSTMNVAEKLSNVKRRIDVVKELILFDADEDAEK